MIDFDDDDLSDDELYGDDEAVSFACEDCDHRWEPDDDFYDLEELICPMCGSSNIVEL